MNFLPPPGPQRWRAIGLLVAILVLAAYYVPRAIFGDSTPAAPPQTANPVGVANPSGATQPSSNPKSASTATKKGVPDGPVALQLAALEPGDRTSSETGRNPFRFGEPPKPPAPPPQPLPAYVPPPPPPPPPPPVPQVRDYVALQLTMLPTDGGKWIATFRDKKSGAMWTGSEGDIIDGRFKLIKINKDSAVVSFLDGSGQATLSISRTGGG